MRYVSHRLQADWDALEAVDVGLGDNGEDQPWKARNVSWNASNEIQAPSTTYLAVFPLVSTQFVHLRAAQWQPVHVPRICVSLAHAAKGPVALPNDSAPGKTKKYRLCHPRVLSVVFRSRRAPSFWLSCRWKIDRLRGLHHQAKVSASICTSRVKPTNLSSLVAGGTKTPCHCSRLQPPLRRCLVCCQWCGNSAGGHANPQVPLCEAQFRIARRARSPFPTHLTANTLIFVREEIH